MTSSTRAGRPLMKKKILSFVLCALLLCPCPARGKDTFQRCLFVTVLQDPPVLSSRQEIERLIDFAKRARIDVLFVQIYRSNQSWFASTIADPSPYEDALNHLSEDPLKILMGQAHEAGIRVYAWLNMLSLGDNKDARLLQKYGPEILTRNRKEKKRLQDYRIDSQYFLEPGDPRVRRELAGIVEEVLAAYPELDGILFDYIRYPDPSPDYGYTQMNMERFQQATGRKAVEKSDKAWQDWKRAQVAELLRELVEKSRTMRPGIGVAATGCAPYIRAYAEAFQDWPSWLNAGVVDFVTFMSYSPDAEEFERFVRDAKTKVSDFAKVMVGVPAYKLAVSPWVFARQLRFSRESGSGGFCVFHYGSLQDHPALARAVIGTHNP